MARFYETCPHCGASLDPGERCDCPETMEEYRPIRRRVRCLGGYDYKMAEVPHDQGNA